LQGFQVSRLERHGPLEIHRRSSLLSLHSHRLADVRCPNLHTSSTS
jgi:hypothetical protein